MVVERRSLEEDGHRAPLTRQGMLYEEIVRDCSKTTLQGISRGNIDPTSLFHSYNCSGYDVVGNIGSICIFELITMLKILPVANGTLMSSRVSGAKQSEGVLSFNN